MFNDSEKYFLFLKKKVEICTVVHTIVLRRVMRLRQEGHEFKANLGNAVRRCLSKD